MSSVLHATDNTVNRILFCILSRIFYRLSEAGFSEARKRFFYRCMINDPRDVGRRDIYVRRFVDAYQLTITGLFATRDWIS